MSLSINKLLISLSLLLVVCLFIGTRAADVPYSDHLAETNIDQDASDFVHYMAKRRFLPTRRETFQPDHDEDESHAQAKRYFLKSKRYFLNSKRDNE